MLVFLRDPINMAKTVFLVGKLSVNIKMHYLEFSIGRPRVFDFF